MTHCDQILTYLRAGGTLTVVEALQKFGIFALSQRCTELRRQGWPIQAEMVRLASGKRVARYSYDHSVYGLPGMPARAAA